MLCTRCLKKIVEDFNPTGLCIDCCIKEITILQKKINELNEAIDIERTVNL